MTLKNVSDCFFFFFFTLFFYCLSFVFCLLLFDFAAPLPALELSAVSLFNVARRRRAALGRKTWLFTSKWGFGFGLQVSVLRVLVFRGQGLGCQC